jgi:hypothetical protein
MVNQSATVPLKAAKYVGSLASTWQAFGNIQSSQRMQSVAYIILNLETSYKRI